MKVWETGYIYLIQAWRTVTDQCIQRKTPPPNLAVILSEARQMPFAELRLMLIEEIRRQKKPFGLVFEEISGGFTFTRTELPQAFKVLPLVVTRVFADGRPDELVRGVDIVGTPLQSLENILATGDDYAVFNGFCGAESGFVPVSATAYVASVTAHS